MIIKCYTPTLVVGNPDGKTRMEREIFTSGLESVGYICKADGEWNITNREEDAYKFTDDREAQLAKVHFKENGEDLKYSYKIGGGEKS